MDKEENIKNIQSPHIKKISKSNVNFNYGADETRIAGIEEKLEVLVQSDTLLKSNDLKKVEELIQILEESIKKNPNLDIEYSKEDGKKIIKITPKNKNLEISTTLEFPKEFLEGHTDFVEFVNEKLKNGESITFDNIKNFKVNNPQFNHWDNLSQLTIQPQKHGESKRMNVLIKGTDIAYHNIEFASIYRDGTTGTLMSFNLPFRMILIISKDVVETTIKFTADEKNMTVLELDKFYRMLMALSSGNEIEFYDSKRETLIMTGRPDLKVNLNINWFKFIQDLAEIDRVFNTNFNIPEKISIEDEETVNNLKFLIQNKYLNANFDSVVLKINRTKLNELIKSMEEKGFIENVLITHEKTKINLFGSEINLGKSEGRLPLVKTKQSIEDLKHLSGEEISIELIPYEASNFKVHYSI